MSPSSRPALGAALMSVATLGFGGMTVMVKLMDQGLPESELVFWRAVFSLPLLIGLAMGAMMGQMFMTSAYRVAPAPLVATVGYVSLPVAALLDWVVFRNAPTPWAIGGGLLIIVSGVYLAYQRPVDRAAAAEKTGE